MKDEMKGQRILYPCYFDAGLTRKGGRRVPRSRAIRDPTLTDIEKALKRCRVRYHAEQKSHPAYWWKNEGRIVADWDQGKEKLLAMVAGALDGRR
ncbi:MAG TPA: signal recognition particle subunit SRP19/SEC65 family protein [Methanoregulaceae archaeon]|nr:signal recognition particle subunit SRP19/SEC65 family protein [Methanoregulaceae archaeon]HPD10950.1 signal recognition particle subunit SRP19/SEC65 family protein [Methanoregulaceae archaeon]HRT15920.1 signal recognition particle subunit SRP19/SEC65 family protein [Methanoregulaceae archaeon]HRU31385.1 signal recognition particle subunit SRP19/SEC65 family protein [Methanoregulaceae archaeon]